MHPLWHKALVIFIPGFPPPTDKQIYNPLGAVCPWYYFQGSTLNVKCHTNMEMKDKKKKSKKKGERMEKGKGTEKGRRHG